MNRWADEDALWGFLAPRLRGWWRRLEVVQPEGLPDSFGLFDNRVHWLELKLGKPGLKAFRPKQLEFAHECIKRGISWHVVFGHKSDVMFYAFPDCSTAITPGFWLTPPERLHASVERARR